MVTYIKKSILFLCVVTTFNILTSNPANSFQADSQMQNCNQCHKLSIEEAESIFKKIMVLAKVTNIQPAAAPGLWEVMFENLQNDGKKGVAYVSYSKKQVLAGLLVDVNKLEVSSGTTFNGNKKINVAHIPLENALIMGNPESINKVIVFDDPDCPYCSKLHREIKTVLNKRDDVAFYVLLYPLRKIHPDAYRKSVAIQCNKSIKLLGKAFRGETIADPTCSTNEIDDNISLAKKLSIRGTPALVFADGMVYDGYISAEKILTFIDR